MKKSELIMPHHLTKKALIYIRQSTPQQQISNQESLRLQYALKQKAMELGWQEKDIQIIDCDLGRSGRRTDNREGFKEVLAKVTLGEVGIVLAWEVTRLSRNCTDLYPLLDICGFRGCLIGDVDGIYDPSMPNGRMILGLKGQISEIELHTIQNRLTAGLENKAARGELAQRLPVGLVRDRQGKVQKHPDLEVQRCLEIIFETFARLGSSYKVMRFLKKNNISIPRQNIQGDIHWSFPKSDIIIKILKQPAYAGAFVRGMRKTIKDPSKPGKKRDKTIAMKDWKYVVKDVYPKYISWETYEKNRAKLKDNYAEYNIRRSRGVSKGGDALLQGIAYCGECGHKMGVQYKKCKRYICSALQRKGLGICQSIQGDTIDNVVVNAFFLAISPIELDAYKKVLEKQKEIDESIEKSHQNQIQRLEYREKLAKRQYDNVDPENRLVASELENRWEQALWELKIAKEEYEKYHENKQIFTLSEEIEQLFKNIGKNLPEIWNSNLISNEKKKQLLRILIDKVVIERIAPDKLKIRIVWKGGENSSFLIPVNVSSLSQMSSLKDVKDIVESWTKEGKSDEEIAEHLTQLGYQSPRKDSFLLNTVERIRIEQGLFRRDALPLQKNVEGYLTISKLSKIIGVSPAWFHYKIKKGALIIKKNKKNGVYLFPDNLYTITEMKKLKEGKVNQLQFS